MKDNRPSLSSQTTGKKRICIIHTKWNAELVDKLVLQTKASLANHLVDIRVVPGCYELPIACQRIAAQEEKYDCIVAIGILIKGETFHFEYIAQSVCQGLMDVQLKANLPIVFGILTTSNVKQVEERIEMDIGKEWGLTALEMSEL